MSNSNAQKWRLGYRPASLEERLPDGVVRCHLSPRNCTLKGRTTWLLRRTRESRRQTGNHELRQERACHGRNDRDGGGESLLAG
jgi:hypothetical protein